MWSGPSRFRVYDLIDRPVGLTMLIVTSPLLLLGMVVSRASTKSSGIFRQTRVGKNQRRFTIHKIQTMGADSAGSTVTTRTDPRITRAGAWLRRYKIDELPQFYDMLTGHMTLVGPRPDVPGYADLLTGDERVVLNVKPGISGPATIFFRNEETLLESANDPVQFNDEVIYPTKVRINRAWIQHGTIADDLRIALMTLRAPRTMTPIRSLVEKWVESAADWPEYQTALRALADDG